MYIEHYGLSGPPFQLTPDARFWFDSRTHRKAMAYLGYGLAQEEGFITITGEIGAGKSTLVAHLVAKVDRARLNTIEIVSTQVEGDDMLRLVAQGLGIDTGGTSKAQILEAVEEALEDEYRGGKRTLIIVDEAQNLPTSALEELRMLSNFHLGGRALIQILLLGQPEFREKIAAPGLEQLRQRVIATHHLEAMGADEIEAYVRHRLRLVGWDNHPEFAEDAFQALFHFTGGVPRRLNQLLNRLLLHGAIEQLDCLDRTAVESVADDMGIECARNDNEPVLPLTPATAEPVDEGRESFEGAQPGDIVTAVLDVSEATGSADDSDPALLAPQPASLDAFSAGRIAALEARLEEQEETIRRVLTLLVNWAEQDPVDRDQRPERRSGTDRRFRAV